MLVGFCALANSFIKYPIVIIYSSTNLLRRMKNKQKEKQYIILKLNIFIAFYESDSKHALSTQEQGTYK